MRQISRWWALYQAIAFVALIPISSYYAITEGLPKTILVIVIPGYALLAWPFYTIFRNASRKKLESAPSLDFETRTSTQSNSRAGSLREPHQQR
jgi:hypothetical protein